MHNNSVGRKRMAIVSPIPTVKINKTVKPAEEKKIHVVGNRVDKIHTLIKKYLHNAHSFFTQIKTITHISGFISKKALYKTLTAIAVVSAVYTAGVCFDFGFDAYLGTHYIGIVKGYEQADKIIDKINLEAGSVKSNQPPRLYLRIISKGSFSDEDTVKNNVRLALGIMQKAVSCSVGDAEPFYVENQTVLNEALSEYMSQYASFGEPSIDAHISKSDAVVYTDRISDKDEIIKILSDNIVPVKTVEYVSKQVETPFEVQQIEDNTKAKGTVIVNEDGVNGLSSQQVKISRINGEISAEEVISSEIIVPAVARVETVGTRETPSGYGTGKFIYPVSAPVTSGFGTRWGRQHKGTDFGADMGTDIHAADNGTVIYSGWENGFGNLVIIDHKNGYKTYYAHCSKTYVETGSVLMAGDVIAAVGNTGNSTGPHLHFEIRYNEVPLDALKYLQ